MIPPLPPRPASTPPVVAAVASPTSANAPDATPPSSQVRRVKTLAGGYTYGTGRRKTAVARVRIRPGEGKFLINDRPAEKYFPNVRDRGDIVAPLRAAECLGKLDILVSVKGGGLSGQAGAVVLGVARALMGFNPDFEKALRSGGYLTRDSRKVERKKYGQSGARKRYQFSKR